MSMPMEQKISFSAIHPHLPSVFPFCLTKAILQESGVVAQPAVTPLARRLIGAPDPANIFCQTNGEVGREEEPWRFRGWRFSLWGDHLFDRFRGERRRAD